MHRLTWTIRRPLAALIAAAGLLSMAPAVSRADLVFYSSRASFDAAAPGLPEEDFSKANLLGQPYITHASPISAATNDSVFAQGSILPGLTVSTLHPGMISNALGLDAGPAGARNVGTNWFQDTLVLSFAPGVSAVGEDVFGNVYPGPSFAGYVTEEVYNGSRLLGSTELIEAAGVIGFLGVTSTAANITSVNLLFTPNADVDSNTFVTNVAFGPSASVPEPTSFVTLSTLAAILLIRRIRPAAGARPGPARASRRRPRTRSGSGCPGG